MRTCLERKPKASWWLLADLRLLCWPVAIDKLKIKTPLLDAPRICSASCHVDGNIEMLWFTTVGPLPLPRGLSSAGSRCASWHSWGKLTHAEVNQAEKLRIHAFRAALGCVGPG